MIQIEITGKLENNIFGQFTGLYKSDEKVNITRSKGVPGESYKLDVSKGNKITVDAMAVKNSLEIGAEYQCEGLWSIYAFNPEKGAVFTVLKVD